MTIQLNVRDGLIGSPPTEEIRLDALVLHYSAFDILNFNSIISFSMVDSESLQVQDGYIQDGYILVVDWRNCHFCSIDVAARQSVLHSGSVRPSSPRALVAPCMRTHTQAARAPHAHLCASRDHASRKGVGTGSDPDSRPLHLLPQAHGGGRDLHRPHRRHCASHPPPPPGPSFPRVPALLGPRAVTKPRHFPPSSPISRRSLARPPLLPPPPRPAPPRPATS